MEGIGCRQHQSQRSSSCDNPPIVLIWGSNGNTTERMSQYVGRCFVCRLKKNLQVTDNYSLCKANTMQTWCLLNITTSGIGAEDRYTV